MGKRLHRADHQRAAQFRSVAASNVDSFRPPGISRDHRNGKVGLDRAGPLPALFQVGAWGVALVFLLRAIGNLRTFGFFKVVKGTAFADWDTWFYSLLCLLIALLVVGLATLPRPR